MNNDVIKKILDVAISLYKEDPKNSFHTSYFHFMDYFSDKVELTDHDLIIGANFTYGWMPTMLHFKSNSFAECVRIINKAKGVDVISSDELLTLKKLVNNSLVGASKLLHFINPALYPIWDSRVCKFLTGYATGVEKLHYYWKYFELCHQICTNISFLKVHHDFTSEIKGNHSPLRTVEQVMFINSSKPLYIKL